MVKFNMWNYIYVILAYLCMLFEISLLLRSHTKSRMLGVYSTKKFTFGHSGHISFSARCIASNKVKLGIFVIGLFVSFSIQLTHLQSYPTARLLRLVNNWVETFTRLVSTSATNLSRSQTIFYV